MAEPEVRIAIMAKAPVPGLAKTRLIPAVGALGAARVHRQLLKHSVACALAARLGPVALWGAPSLRHPLFRALARRSRLELRTQPGGDLGQRMAAVLDHSLTDRPTLLIGSDCPALLPTHLRQAAACLHNGRDAVFIPAEDGGYVLVGLRQPQPELFQGIAWSSERVMAQTRDAAATLRLTIEELPALWDVDRPEDLARWQTLTAQARGG